MQLPYATSETEQDNTSRDALVIINDEPFSRECLVQAMRSIFPQNAVIGLSVAQELHQIAEPAIALILLRIQNELNFKSQLAAEIGAVTHQHPAVPIAILSPCINTATIGEAIELGVCGIIPVTTPFKVAVAALQLVMAGGTYYPYPHSGDLRSEGTNKAVQNNAETLPQPRAQTQSTARPSLTVVEEAGNVLSPDDVSTNVIFTTREAEVLEALQRGWSNKWIAHSLQLSENTVKVHIQHIMRKLRATNRTEAVVRHRQLNPIR